MVNSDMLFYLVALLAIFTLILCVVAFSNITGLIRARGVPFVPLTRAKMTFLQKHVKLNQDTRVIDLGCGDGRVLRLFERQGVQNLVGYEVNLSAAIQAGLQKFFHRSKAEIHYKNFYKINLSGFNVVFCYLLPNALLPLREKFDKELRPGTKIISYDFAIENWRQPEEIFRETRGGKNNAIYIYEV